MTVICNRRGQTGADYRPGSGPDHETENHGKRRVSENITQNDSRASLKSLFLLKKKAITELYPHVLSLNG